MEAGLYVALSGQVALQRRLDTIANNVANSSTPGFRAENVTFESVLSRSQVEYAGRGDATFSAHKGAVVQTGNPLDVAILGDAYLAIATPGGIAYTRDGRLNLSPAGDLETVGGLAVLDAGGGPIQINAAAGPVQIARNGQISQNGERVATLGLFQLAPNAELTRGDGASMHSDRAAEPVTDFAAVGLAQGFIENSNVNAVLEVTRLIGVSRAFEGLSAAIDQSERHLGDAIKTLSSGRGA